MRNFLLAGVGGQGTILAGDVIAAVGLALGQDVKKAEVHGMAQRGGSVITHVRWGKHVYSPLFGRGEADYLLAFEKLEALRYVDMLRIGSVAVISDDAIPPLSVTSGNAVYPDDDRIHRAITAVARTCLVPGLRWAEEVGSSRVQNVVMIGALAAFVPNVPEDVWLAAIESRVPVRFAAMNRQAFLKGHDTVREMQFPNPVI